MPIDPISLGMAAMDKIQGQKDKITGIAYNEYGNWRNRKFAREMYDKQYQDNIAFWQMQNEYNLPKNQMQRFQDAGLNPNLIYGQGNSGNAGSIQTPSQDMPNFQPAQLQPTLSGLQMLSEIYALDQRQAQTDNLKAQNDVIKEDAALRRAQVRATLTDAERKVFDLTYLQDTRDINLQSAQERLRQQRVVTDNSIEENARRAALTAKTLQEAAERLKQMPLTRAETRARIDNLLKDGTLKRIEIDLREDGINPNDPMWQRLLAKLLTDLIEGDYGKPSVTPKTNGLPYPFNLGKY